MSIKIYNGYRLPMMSVTELNSFILRVQEKAIEIQKDIASSVLANCIASDLDELFVFGEEEFKNRGFDKGHDSEKLYPYLWPIQKAHQLIKKRYQAIQETGHRDPVVDFDFELIVIPDGTKMIVLLYTEQKAFQTYWESLPEVSYYGYWNNSDPDKDTSPEEWKQRKMDWLRVWPYDKRSKEIGLNLSIIKGIPEIY